VLCCVMCVVLWLCLIVAPLPPGINPFAVNNNNNNNNTQCFHTAFTPGGILNFRFSVRHDLLVVLSA
jgi:hypothetical protein